MKKSHKYDELSTRQCSAPKCVKFIKQRMVETVDAHRCYACHCKKESLRGHTINSKSRMKRIAKGLPVKNFG
jgi:hypothetical protein